MPILAKKLLINIYLIICVLGSIEAQERKVSFTWFDQSQKEMAGYISYRLLSLQGDNLYQLDFSVIWNNQNGNPVADTSKMPFLCLSKWDFEWAPQQNIRCTSFDQKKRGLAFQTREKLVLQVLNGYTGAVEITARFQYALTRVLYDTGKWDKIEANGSDAVKMVLQVESKKAVTGTEVTSNSRKPNINVGYSPALMKVVSENYQNLEKKVKDFAGRKSVAELNRPGYRQELETLSATIINERSQLNADSLPKDTFQLYREHYNRLNDSVFNLREEYLRFQISQSDRVSGEDPSIRQRRNDSLRNLVRTRTEPIMQNQLDSLNKITQVQNDLATGLAAYLADRKRINLGTPGLDSLKQQQGFIKMQFAELVLLHENTWKDYRIDIDRLMPLSEIENLHNAFLKARNNVQSALDKVDSSIQTTSSGTTADNPWYMSNRVLWTALLGVLLFVFASAIWNNARSRKILKERLAIFQDGNSGNLTGKAPVDGLFSNDSQQEYFTIDYQETIPEAVVGKIHYHPSAIKTVYQLVQGALMEKKSTDFGGYLFGNQYKLHNHGVTRSEVFIEKACDSKYLRSSISNDVGARADLIDELDELVNQNKKLRLLGWFASSTDNIIEIPEGMMKIHRTFFKEKWQIGVLINPGSEVLQGAGFLRRRSGYLDPLPDPGAFVKWDDLYRFALNPVSNLKTEPSNGHANKKYSRIELNNTWGDSIVTGVNFDSAVVDEVLAAAAMQAIPKDNYQVVGYLYGTMASISLPEGKGTEYEVFIDRFIELSNELTPRDLPGLLLLGWWGQAKLDVMNYIQNAVNYHEQSFRESYQISCLANPSSGELRILTRKHSLEMNNSTIETEEYELKSLLSR